MDLIRQSLGVSNETTKHSKLYRRPLKADEQTHIKDNVPLVDGYNYMIFLSFLHFIIPKLLNLF